MRCVSQNALKVSKSSLSGAGRPAKQGGAAAAAEGTGEACRFMSAMNAPAART